MTVQMRISVVRWLSVWVGIALLWGQSSTCRGQSGVSYLVDPSFNVQNWRLEDGLPSNEIRDLEEDAYGYMWLSTSDGLVRFDGNRFETFEAATSGGLISNRLRDLYYTSHGARNGALWAHTEQGQIVQFADGVFTAYERLDGTGHRIRYRRHMLSVDDTLWVTSEAGISFVTDGLVKPFLPEHINVPVVSFARDRHGTLWLGTQDAGVWQIDKGGRRTIYTEADGLPDNRVNWVLEDYNDVWVGTERGVARIRAGAVTLLEKDGMPWSRYTAAGFLERSGLVWLATPDGWWRYTAEDGLIRMSQGDAVSTSRARANASRTIRQGPEGHVWRVEIERSTTQGTLYHIVRSNDRLFTLPVEVNALQFDARGSLWVATNGAGLFRLRNQLWTTLDVREETLGPAINALLEDQSGTVWVGTTGYGLMQYREGKLVEVEIALKRPDGRQERLASRESGLSVLALYEDSQGRIWIGTDRGLCTWKQGASFCEEEVLPSEQSFSHNVRAMLEDKTGTLWLGSRHGLWRGTLIEDGYRWHHITNREGLTNDWIRRIVETRDGAVLVGTNGGGLLQTSAGSNEAPGTTAFFEALTVDDGLASNNIRDLYEDERGTLWVATEDNGLCQLDREGSPSIMRATIRCIQARDGLYDNSLYRLLPDTHGRFWFNTNRGVFWVSLEQLYRFAARTVNTLTSVSYTEKDGLQSSEGTGGTQYAGIRSRSGELWFPTRDGVAIIQPDQVPQPETPRVLIQSAGIGQEILPHPDAIALGPDQRDLDITFTAIEFTRPEDVRYRVRLLGQEEAWRSMGTRNVASYTNLAPGSYTFEVQAGVGGTWSNTASLSVVRAGYVWESAWLYVFLMGCAVGVAYLGYRGRMRQIRAARDKLEVLVKERTSELEAQRIHIEDQARALQEANVAKNQFLTNISHEFRTPLTLTFGPIEDALSGHFKTLEEARPHFERARRNGSRLLHLINQLLDLAHLEKGGVVLRTERRDLVGFLTQLAAVFESVAHTKEINYDVHMAPDSLVLAFDADSVEKIVMNLLSNAFKFTPAGGHIRLSLAAITPDEALICIEDTGEGIHKEDLPRIFDRFYQAQQGSARKHEGSGIGLALVKELVTLHNGTIQVESSVGEGTRFMVRLPSLEPVLRDEKKPQQEPLSMDGSNLVVEPPFGETIRTEAPPERIDEGVEIPADPIIVLVVEDHAEMRAYIRGHLENDFVVEEAYNGMLGLEKARELVPDLILIDVLMPEMDGLQLSRHLKDDVRTSHIPLVMLTAVAGDAARIDGLQHGAEAYLTKPFNADMLRAQIERMVVERRRIQGQSSEVGTSETDSGMPERERLFLERLHLLIQERLGDSQFGVEFLAEEVAMSPRQLQRKVRALTGGSPAEMIREARLHHAAKLLKTQGLGVQEVAKAVGYLSTPSFSRAFRRKYGVPPADVTKLG